MRIQAVLLCTLVAACSGDNEYAVLFDAPTGTASGSMLGTWGGAYDIFDTRWVLAPDRITLANRCGSRIVGVDVAAEVTPTAIRFLESAEGGNDSCFVRTTPSTLTTCSTDPFELKELCFEHTGLTLTIYESPVEYIELTKLTDATP